MPNTLLYISLIMLILCSAFFSGSEIVYASANGMRLRRRMEESGGFYDKLAYYIYERYESALTSILVGNNLVNIAASSIATVLVIDLLGNAYAWVATVVMTLLILTFGEILPKVLAKQMADRLAPMIAAPLRVLMFVTKPIDWVVSSLVKKMSRFWSKGLSGGPTVTEDDLENIIDTAEDEGVIDEERSELLQSALDFDGVLAYEIITPRVDLLAVDIEDSFQEIMEVVANSPYSRIPVYKDNVDNIVGILHLNRLYKRLTDEKEFDIREILMPAQFVHKTMALPEVLAEMKKTKFHMAVVTDEYGGTMGVLTMEDVLEQLVGDIWDESDEVIDEFVEISENLYEADGTMRIHDFFEELDIDDRDYDEDNATLGGWAIEMLGGYPQVGDHFDFKHLTVTIRRLKKHRVDRMIVRVNESSDDRVNA